MVSPRYASHVVGNGPIVIELWLDFVCPFSRKQFEKLNNEVIPLAQAQFPGKFSWVFLHQMQPWHGQSVWLHEVAIAAGLVAPNRFWDISAELFANSERFYDEAIVNKSRDMVINELVDIVANAGADRQAVASLVKIKANPHEPSNPGPAVVNDVKYFVMLGRQNGIHVSPTVMINGLVDNTVSSSSSTEEWVEKLQDLVEVAKYRQGHS